MRIIGKAFVFGDNMETSEISSERFLESSTPGGGAAHTEEKIHTGSQQKKDVKEGIITAGHNFGCGSSDINALKTLQGVEIVCVIARSFSPVFLQSAIEENLPVVELTSASEINEGDVLEVNFQDKVVSNQTQNKKLFFSTYPSDLSGYIFAGEYLEQMGIDKKTVLENYFQKIAQFPFKSGSTRF